MKLTGSQTSVCYFLLIVLAVIAWQPPHLFALAQAGGVAPPVVPDLQIVILEGEDGVNIIKKKTAVKPVVEVRDKNRAPGAAIIAGGVAGVVVLFVLPESGPSGVFANGARWTRAVTDANGRAVAGEIRPIGKGSFKVEIRASYQGQTVTRTITQTNFSTIAAAHKAGKTPGSSTHDEVANENAAEGTGQAVAATSAAAGAGAGTAATASHHTGLIVGLAAAGAAAAGGAAYAVSKSSSNSNSSNQQQSCSSLCNQLKNDLQNAAFGGACSGGSDPQCVTLENQIATDYGNYSSCVGSAQGPPPLELVAAEILNIEIGNTTVAQAANCQ